MAGAEPTSEERRQLGEALLELVQGLQTGRNITDTIAQIIREHHNRGQSTRYLVNVQQALIALNDFLRLIPRERLPGVIRAVYEAQGVHPDVFQGLLGRASSTGANLLEIIQSFNGHTDHASNPCIRLLGLGLRP